MWYNIYTIYIQCGNIMLYTYIVAIYIIYTYIVAIYIIYTYNVV